MSEQKQVQEGGNATLSVKVPVWVADLLNIIAEGLQHGTNGNDLLRKCLEFVIETAKCDGPVPPEMKTLLNMLKLDKSWHNSFNFADVTRQLDIAQIVLILQQPERKGFGLAMIDKPFMGATRMTLCVDDILERIAEVSMKGLYKELRQIGVIYQSDSLRETLTMMCDAQLIDHLKQMDDAELPGYGEHHDFGRAIEYGRKHKRIHHKSPDSIAQQQSIKFGDIDREVADYEAKEWEGEQRQTDFDNPLGDVKPFTCEP